MSTKVVISLPVHESPETVVNQINNIRYFVPDSVVVLHISEFFNWGDKSENLDVFKLDNVIINPERFPTKWRSGILVDVHNSNFRFALENLDFDYFALHSSNDMFVKRGVENYIDKHDAGVAAWSLQSIKDFFKSSKNFSNVKETDVGKTLIKKHPSEDDTALSTIIKHLGVAEVYGSQIEGSFYRAEIFKEMVDEIERFYSYKDISSGFYAREEFYYPTVAAKFVKNAGGVYTFFNWKEDISIETVKDVVACKKCSSEGNNFDFTDIYNVKRIPRDVNNPVREFITGLGND